MIHEMNVRFKVGQRIRYWRRLRGLNTTQLGVLVELDQSQISKIENGVSDTSITTLSRICGVLNTTLEEFFNHEDFNLLNITLLDKLLILARKLKAEEQTVLIQLAERLNHKELGKSQVV